MKESNVLKLVRLAAAKIGVTTWRNSVGMLRDEFGGIVRFGLCKGSSDLVGFYQHVVRQEDVGRRIAVFAAIETKRSKGGKLSDEQKDFLTFIANAGGIAIVARGEDDLRRGVSGWASRTT